MTVVALLVAQPGQPDQLIAYAGEATFEEFLEGLKERLAGASFRVTALDFGTFEIGDDRPRTDIAPALRQSDVDPQNVVYPTLQRRELWRVNAEGVADHLILTPPTFTADEIRKLASGYPAYRDREADLVVVPVESGVFTVRQIVFSMQRDARWFDQTGRLAPAPG
jgi:hypothetical protein